MVRIRLVLLATLGLCAAEAHAGLTFETCRRDNESVLPCTLAAPALGGAAGVTLYGDDLYVSALDDAALSLYDTSGGTSGTFVSCLQSSASRNGVAAECSRTVEGLSYSNDVLIPADGRFAYVGGSTVLTFDRDGATGELTPTGSAPHPAVNSNLTGIAMTPDGQSLYSISGYPDATAPGGIHSVIGIYERDPATGALTPAGCVANPGHPAGCAVTHSAIAGPTAIVALDDAVLVANRDSNTVVMLRRSAAAGHPLAVVECVGQVGVTITGCSPTASGLTRPATLNVSPDTNTIIAGTDAGTIAFLTRAGEILFFSGCLRSTGVVEDVCTESGTVGGAGELYVSPDGANAYVGGRGLHGLGIFARDIDTGFLSAAGCVRDAAEPATSPLAACTASAPGLRSAGQMVLNGAGNRLFVSVQGQFTNVGALLTFTRTPDARIIGSPRVGVATLPLGPFLRVPVRCPTGEVKFCSGRLTVDPAPAGARAAAGGATAKAVARRGTRLRVRIRLSRAAREAGRVRVTFRRRNANGTTTRTSRLVSLVSRR